MIKKISLLLNPYSKQQVLCKPGPYLTIASCPMTCKTEWSDAVDASVLHLPDVKKLWNDSLLQVPFHKCSFWTAKEVLSSESYRVFQREMFHLAFCLLSWDQGKCDSSCYDSFKASLTTKIRDLFWLYHRTGTPLWGHLGHFCWG